MVTNKKKIGLQAFPFSIKSVPETSSEDTEFIGDIVLPAFRRTSWKVVSIFFSTTNLDKHKVSKKENFYGIF